MTNADVAHVFNEIATLLEILGEDSYRVNAYRKVARAIKLLTPDVAELCARGELESIDGIGTSSATKIKELIDTGRISYRQELLAKVPESVLRLLAIPSVGARRVHILWREVGIESIEDLKRSLRSGKLALQKNFGPKTIDQLVRGIEFIERAAGRTRLGMAWKVSTLLGGAVLAMKGIERAEFAGSLRRGCETVGDLDLVCAAADPAAIVKQFVELPHVTQVINLSADKALVLVNYEPYGSLRVELRAVPATSFGAAWRYYTGSKSHNVQMRERAEERGWTLSEYGLFDGDRLIAAATEEEIYQALDMPWIPPEMRENLGEFMIKEVPPDLILERHIRGDLHMHTSASDGRNSLNEMANAARERGYEYICITEHSQGSALAGGLSESVLAGRIKDLRKFNTDNADLIVWVGSEVDIKADGSLDYPDELLAQLDFVVASIHHGMSRDKDANTRRTLAAIRNPYVNAIGHPTGRLINERSPMPLDFDAIFKEAAKTGTALEINANNFRLDLRGQHARAARNAGAKIVIDTDAHAIDQLDQMRFGIMTARRGWLRRRDVLNTYSASDVANFVNAKRQRLGGQPRD